MTITLNGNGAVTGLTALPDSAMSLGSILQIQEGSTNSRTHVSSSDFQATNLNCSITPISSSNKVLVQVSGDCNTNGDDNELALTVYRSIDSGTYTNLGNATYGFVTARSDAARLHSAVSIQFFDSPNTTDSINYKVYMKRAGGSNGNVEFPVNNGWQYAYMHLSEVAA